VILGALARIPAGLLTDRFGGRLIFALLILISAAAAFLVPHAGSYSTLPA
jgi:NNP family nitrate/nitrite transporter-like MFS transporter